jgi:hypothetical protein
MDIYAFTAADGTVSLGNVPTGARYLRGLLAMFDSDVSLALAAFNAGENAVKKHGNRIPLSRDPALCAVGARLLPALPSSFRQAGLQRSQPLNAGNPV